MKVIKIVKDNKFQRVWQETEAKSCFHWQLFTKYLRLTLALMQKSAEKVYFLFFKSFLLVLKKSSLWQEDWALDYYYIKF